MRFEQLQTLLTQPDAVTERELAAQYAAPFDTEQLFQKSYAKFRGTGISSHPLPLWRRPAFRACMTAACLLLVVGFGAGLRSKQPKIDPQPPQNIPPAATEAASETAALSTESETAAETSQTVTEAASPAPAESTALPAVTGTDAPEVIPTETEAPQVISTAAANVPTEAAVTDAGTAAVTETPTEPLTDAPETTCVPAMEQISGFRVMQYPGYRQVICTDAFPEPDGALSPYTVEGGVTLLGTQEEEAAVRSYEVEEGGKRFTVTQREYAEFVLNIEEGDLIDIGLSKAHGFFLLQDDACTLYWFCDGEGFCVSGDIADLQSLLAIVRSFTPAEQSE